MADLHIDGAALAGVRTGLARVRDLLDAPGRQMMALDADCVGTADLRARMADFGDEWAYGISKPAKMSDEAVSALNEIEKRLREVDEALTQALRSAGGHGPAP